MNNNIVVFEYQSINKVGDYTFICVSLENNKCLQILVYKLDKIDLFQQQIGQQQQQKDQNNQFNILLQHIKQLKYITFNDSQSLPKLLLLTKIKTTYDLYKYIQSTQASRIQLKTILNKKLNKNENIHKLLIDIPVNKSQTYFDQIQMKMNVININEKQQIMKYFEAKKNEIEVIIKKIKEIAEEQKRKILFEQQYKEKQKVWFQQESVRQKNTQSNRQEIQTITQQLQEGQISFNCDQFGSINQNQQPINKQKSQNNQNSNIFKIGGPDANKIIDNIQQIDQNNEQNYYQQQQQQVAKQLCSNYISSLQKSNNLLFTKILQLQSIIIKQTIQSQVYNNNFYENQQNNEDKIQKYIQNINFNYFQIINKNYQQNQNNLKLLYEIKDNINKGSKYGQCKQDLIKLKMDQIQTNIKMAISGCVNIL